MRAMVAAEALWKGKCDAWADDFPPEYLHRAHGKNQSHKDLLRPRHLQVPDKDAWQDGVDPIADADDGGVNVDQGDGGVGVDAAALAAGVAGVEVLRRPALADEEDEETRAEKLRDDEGGPDDDAMQGFNRQAEQHDRNRSFDGHVGNHVNMFTEPPELSPSALLSRWEERARGLPSEPLESLLLGGCSTHVVQSRGGHPPSRRQHGI